jgi:RNA binding exosome subunit
LKGPIQSVEATCLVHATEDSGKLETAILELLGTQAKPDLERLEGHYGNEILRARLHLTGEEAEKAFETLVGRIPPSVRQELLADLPSHIDEHSALFLRFDKQSLVSGSVVMGSSDAVRVKVKPRAFMMRGGAPQFFEGLLGGR